MKKIAVLQLTPLNAPTQWFFWLCAQITGTCSFCRARPRFNFVADQLCFVTCQGVYVFKFVLGFVTYTMRVQHKAISKKFWMKSTFYSMMKVRLKELSYKIVVITIVFSQAGELTQRLGAESARIPVTGYRVLFAR